MLTLVHGPMLRVLTASDDGTAKVWSAASGECLQTFSGHGESVCRLRSLLSMRLKRFPVQQWCGDGVSDCLGTVRRTFAGSEISVDTHPQGGGIEKMMHLRSSVGCVCLVHWRLHICFRVISQVGRPFVPRHPKWTIKHLVVVGVRPTVITHRTVAQGTLSSRTCPHQCAHLHTQKHATRFLTLKQCLSHTPNKCTTDNVLLLWKTCWSAFYQVPQDVWMARR